MAKNSKILSYQQSTHDKSIQGLEWRTFLKVGRQSIATTRFKLFHIQELRVAHAWHPSFSESDILSSARLLTVHDNVLGPACFEYITKSIHNGATIAGGRVRMARVVVQHCFRSQFVVCRYVGHASFLAPPCVALLTRDVATLGHACKNHALPVDYALSRRRV